MPKAPQARVRKQRHKREAGQAKEIISAAISIDTQLYKAALGVAERLEEGNFSRYVRKLIKKDLGRVA